MHLAMLRAIYLRFDRLAQKTSSDLLHRVVFGSEHSSDDRSNFVNFIDEEYEVQKINCRDSRV